MTITMTRLMILGAFPLALAACEGGTLGGSTQSVPDLATAAEYFAAGDEIFVKFEDAFNNFGYDAPSALQASGSATYTGSMFLENEAVEGAIGGMRLDANFSTNSITGVVDNFVDYDDLPLQGQIDITNGVINRDADTTTEYTYIADINGSLVNTANQTAQVSGEMFGDFYEEQDFVAGAVSAEITVGADSEFLLGGFVGER